jgi:membrane-bound metal-dependent hydrolase YbcI (DUF457 family)
MWTFGHICFGYIIGRPLFGKYALKPMPLLSIFLFAVAIDGAHVNPIRDYTHSFVFVLPFLIILLTIFYYVDLIAKDTIIPLFIVGISHVIGDILFGNFQPLIPVSYEEIGIFGWGSYFHLMVEIGLFVIMMLILYITGDLKMLEKVPLFRIKEKRGERIYQNLILFGLTVVSIAQIGAIIYLDLLRLPNFYNQAVYNDGSMVYISVMFAIAQGILLYIFIKWMVSRIRGARLMKSKERANED